MPPFHINSGKLYPEKKKQPKKYQEKQQRGHRIEDKGQQPYTRMDRPMWPSSKGTGQTDDIDQQDHRQKPFQ